MNNLRHQKYASNNTRVLKVKNRPLESENDFKLIKISLTHTDKFENKEQQRRR